MFSALQVIWKRTVARHFGKPLPPAGRAARFRGVYGLIDKSPMGSIMNKGMTVRSAQQHGAHYMPRLLEHASKGELNPSFLVTHRFSLEDSPHGYDLFKHKEGGCVRSVFVPN